MVGIYTFCISQFSLINNHPLFPGCSMEAIQRMNNESWKLKKEKWKRRSHAHVLPKAFRGYLAAIVGSLCYNLRLPKLASNDPWPF